MLQVPAGSICAEPGRSPSSPDGIQNRRLEVVAAEVEGGGLTSIVPAEAAEFQHRDFVVSTKVQLDVDGRAGDFADQVCGAFGEAAKGSVDDRAELRVGRDHAGGPDVDPFRLVVLQ